MRKHRQNFLKPSRPDQGCGNAHLTGGNARWRIPMKWLVQEILNTIIWVLQGFHCYQGCCSLIWSFSAAQLTQVQHWDSTIGFLQLSSLLMLLHTNICHSLLSSVVQLQIFKFCAQQHVLLFFLNMHPRTPAEEAAPLLFTSFQFRVFPGDRCDSKNDEFQAVVSLKESFSCNQLTWAVAKMNIWECRNAKSTATRSHSYIKNLVFENAGDLK